MVRVRSVLVAFVAASLALGFAGRRAGGARRCGGDAAELTLDQALAMARKRNRSLVVERARLAQAQTNIEQAWAALFPTITAQGKYTHNDHAAKFPFTNPDDDADAVFTLQPSGAARRHRSTRPCRSSRRRRTRRSKR